MKTTKYVALALLAIFLASPLYALNTEAQQKFDLIMNLQLKELGRRAAYLLEKDYPNEKWSAYKFPGYVQQDLETEAAYKIAVKRPELLGVVNVADEDVVIPCYCTCDSFGHDNLLYCFYKDGDPGNGFDSHGSQCIVCIRQALLAYLWSDLGASHEEIMSGMKIEFASLIEKHHQHDHGK